MSDIPLTELDHIMGAVHNVIALKLELAKPLDCLVSISIQSEF